MCNPLRCIGLSPVLIMSISPMKEVGDRMGTIFLMAGVGALTGPPIGGAIARRIESGNYDFAAVFSGASYFLAPIFIAILRARLVGWKLSVKRGERGLTNESVNSSYMFPRQTPPTTFSNTNYP